MSKRKRTTKEPKTNHTPLRFQISPPTGSAVENELLDLLAGVPQPLRASVNIGRLFRQVMLENDKEIAKMIRTTMQREQVH
jgi:hypothetical protein